MISLVVLVVLVVLVLLNNVISTELTDLYFKGYDENKKDDMNAGVHLHLNNTATCSYEATCEVSNYAGACVSISSGCCSGNHNK